jgi:hypothetical protein
MPPIINSAPSCVTDAGNAEANADDSVDFILQAPYADCAGIMTFGPGSTYGEEGAAAETAYYVLTYLGIIVMLLAIVYWVYWERGRLAAHVMRLRARDGDGKPPAATTADPSL